MTNNDWLVKEDMSITDISVAIADDWGCTRIYIIWHTSGRGKILKLYEMTVDGYPRDRSYWLWKFLDEEHE